MGCKSQAVNKHQISALEHYMHFVHQGIIFSTVSSITFNLIRSPDSTCLMNCFWSLLAMASIVLEIEEHWGAHYYYVLRKACAFTSSVPDRVIVHLILTFLCLCSKGHSHARFNEFSVAVIAMHNDTLGSNGFHGRLIIITE